MKRAWYIGLTVGSVAARLAVEAAPMSAQSYGSASGRYGTLLDTRSIRETSAPGEAAVFYAVHLNTTAQDQPPMVTCPYELAGFELVEPISSCEIPEVLAPGDSAWIRLEGRLPTEPGRYSYDYSTGGGMGSSGFTIDADAQPPEASPDPPPIFLTAGRVDPGVTRLSDDDLARLVQRAFAGVRLRNVPAADSAISVLADRYRVLEVEIDAEGVSGLQLSICPRLRPSRTRPARCGRTSSLSPGLEDLFLGADIVGRLIAALQRYELVIDRAEAR